MYVSEWEWENPETHSTNILMWTASDSSSKDTTLLSAAAIPRLPSQAMSGVPGGAERKHGGRKHSWYVWVQRPVEFYLNLLVCPLYITF